MLKWIKILLDRQVRANTADKSFDTWINGNERYHPTILWNMKPELLFMAREFDKAQRRMGRAPRVWPLLPATIAEEKIRERTTLLWRLTMAETHLASGQVDQAQLVVKKVKRQARITA